MLSFLKYLAVSCCSVHFPEICHVVVRTGNTKSLQAHKRPLRSVKYFRTGIAMRELPSRRYAPDPAESPLKICKKRFHRAVIALRVLQILCKAIAGDFFYRRQAADAAIAPPCPVQPEMRCRASVQPQFRPLLPSAGRCNAVCHVRCASALRRSLSPDTAPVSRTASPPARYILLRSACAITGSIILHTHNTLISDSPRFVLMAAPSVNFRLDPVVPLGIFFVLCKLCPSGANVRSISNL